MDASVQLCGVPALVESLDQGELRSEPTRLARALKSHYQRVWRVLRRSGLEPRDADEAAQDVFCILSRRAADVPREAECSFLLGTAVRVAADRRRLRRRFPEVELDPDTCVEESDLEELVALRQARGLLDEALASLSEEQRVVFVLSEMEQLTAPEVANALSIPVGTVASRLRTSRQVFDEAIRRIHSREQRGATVRKL